MSFPGFPSRWLGVAAIAAALGLPASAPAQPDASALARLGDPLELARQVDAIGDDAVLAVLEGGSLTEQLGAIRATPWLVEPERALGPLAALAAGDDPDLAPAAARAGGRVAARLERDALLAREADLAGLDPSPWTALAADETARPDLRALGERVAAMLEALR